MNSRMERYSETNNSMTVSRVNKNQELYNDINNTTLTRVRTNNNYKVLDDVPKEINIEKIKNYIDSMVEEKEERKKIIINKSNEPIEEPSEEPKIYDINSIIEEAKSKKENSYEEDKYKKLHNTEFDILKKIEMYNKKEEKEEPEFNTSERTLIDLINTITLKKEETDLLSELTTGSENTIITKPIKEELESEVKIEKINPLEEVNENHLSNIDKSFYTNSMNFSKEDFEGLEELEKEVNKNNFFVKFLIFLLVLLVIGTITIILNYVLNLGLF